MKSVIIKRPKLNFPTRYIVWIMVIMIGIMAVRSWHTSNIMDQAADTILSLQAEVDRKPRTLIVVADSAPLPGFAADVPLELQWIFSEMGGKYKIEPTLLAAVARQESNFCSDALSHKGAMGLMGFMPITIRHLREKHDLSINPWVPRSAIEGAAVYLQELQERFKGDQVLAAYNLGPTRLRALGGDFSSIQETSNYVQKINGSLGGSLSGGSMPF